MESCHFFTETNAASAVNASIHVSDNKRSDVLVLNCSFIFIVAAS